MFSKQVFPKCFGAHLYTAGTQNRDVHQSLAATFSSVLLWSTKAIRLIKDGEPRMATSAVTHFLSSEARSSMLLLPPHKP